MPRLSLWNPTKGNDYSFIDRIVGEHLYAGGTGVHVHKYIGIHETPETGDATRPGSAGDSGPSEIFIQDLLFLENRDRKYDDNIYELRGQYQIQDTDAFDLTQFGLFLANGQIFMNFHIESMVSALGRKLMAGDVIELPHLRDDLLLGTDDAINRYFVVQDGSRPSDGYDPMWWPHLWRVKLGTITDSQEYRDILGTGENEDDLRNLISTYQQNIQINDAIIEQAEKDVPFDPQMASGSHLYYDPDLPDRPGMGLNGKTLSAGAPPNGVQVSGSGTQFPTDAGDDTYFLRTDFQPNRLFRKQGARWIKVADDNTQAWAAANRVLQGYINNDDFTVHTDGSVEPERVNLSKVVRPKTDN